MTTIKKSFKYTLILVGVAALVAVKLIFFPYKEEPKKEVVVNQDSINNVARTNVSQPVQTIEAPSNVVTQEAVSEATKQSKKHKESNVPKKTKTAEVEKPKEVKKKSQDRENLEVNY